MIKFIILLNGKIFCQVGKVGKVFLPVGKIFYQLAKNIYNI